MDNQERFISSCEAAGEADVRSKLGSGRYSQQKVLWATDWLEGVESGKTDSTKAAERSNSENALRAKHHFGYVILTVLAVLVIAGALIVFKPR